MENIIMRKFMLLTGIVLSLVTVQATAQDQRAPKPNVSAETLALYEPGEFEGVQYRLMKPIDFDVNRTYPLILSLHGAGGRGSQNIKNLRNWNEWLAKSAHPHWKLMDFNGVGVGQNTGLSGRIEPGSR